MHTLYTRPQTGGFAVHAVLEEAGLAYELVTVDNEPPPDFSTISPLGQVPALRLPDGTTMTESAAMCIYLADLVPASNLSPSADSPLRPHYLRWMLFCAANIYMADLRHYYSKRHTTNPADIEGIKAAARADMDQQFAILNGAIAGSDWILGDSFSTADIYIAMLAYWHPDVPGLMARNRNLDRLCNAVKARPAVKSANEYHDAWTFAGGDN